MNHARVARSAQHGHHHGGYGGGHEFGGGQGFGGGVGPGYGGGVGPGFGPGEHFKIISIRIENS